MCQASGRMVHHRSLIIGATVIINKVDSLEELVETINKKRITYLVIPPTYIRTLTDYAINKPLLFPNIKTASVFSSILTSEQRIEARKKVTPNIFERFGTNECGMLSSATPEDQDAFPNSVGRLVDNVEVEIVDENDCEVPANRIGYLRARSPNFPTEYINAPKATQKHFRKGWFYPNDLAAVNEQGYLFFKGRADDVINKSGTKFYPIEVEEVLLSFPGVLEAAVFGWPHPILGEVAAACVVTKKGVSAKELKDFYTRKLTSYMRPQYLLAVDSMPKNAMNKIVKDKLKQKLSLYLSKTESKSS